LKLSISQRAAINILRGMKIAGIKKPDLAEIKREQGK
jgi:hypothetical protein